MVGGIAVISIVINCRWTVGGEEQRRAWKRSKEFVGANIVTRR